ncbi:MAG TPA: bifunctional isocitrate dehydrogenase kinase/phosphatase [Rhodocyclaceae bacterium]|nr:bifunctional isocitrate dehydrogenase kinase/phosphatase [Rhodocyclaceae bacterium]HNB77175.1 bifunctional isocitrate dehydrogenase kinase/phosphatase [Rhodocyclaceae bacterium]HNH11502.1 bifunctional isocitrate dehydrogenase kinase/phosphatase [Rhodocyclaceae bacterium]HNH97951.1 bifunctional isocitrate dehydrogenase kinase/phosphatase [Rhodocyclaceae bacterium]
MQKTDTPDSVPHSIAQAMIEGFNKHYRLFRETSAQAKARFEQSRWAEVQVAVKERIRYYEERVAECVDRLRNEFKAESLDDAAWQQAKLHFIGMLVNHKQPELAETFFNSVSTKILHHTYFHNQFIFVRPAISTEYMESDPPTYRCYYPKTEGGLRSCIRQLFLDIGWGLPFANLDRDVDHIMRTVKASLGGEWPEIEANCQIQVLNSPFYRNKGAYVIGKTVNGHQEWPFAIPVLHDADGKLVLDTILLEAWRISLLFSLSRAYFMADMEAPSGYIQFLRGIMPNKPRSELYTMIGLAKQGKTMFYRDLLHHLRHSDDQFIEAPGIRGLVMHVFMLPSYPYVFKIIKDRFGSSKDTTREQVKKKFLMVKQVDRVGRMADTLEFTELALPKTRFSPELLEQLFDLAPSIVKDEGANIIIDHCYIERRMTPLNMYLENAGDERIDHAVREYGNAIRELARANIFPGDLLWKNFGVTRYGRVVFYDYDEIEYLTDCNFRRIPAAPYADMELSGEVWYSVAKNDVFPEEFGTFLLGNAKIRAAFMKYHRDLLDAAFWQRTQEIIRRGELEDFFPYPESLRFCNAFAEAATAGETAPA